MFHIKTLYISHQVQGYVFLGIYRWTGSFLKYLILSSLAEVKLENHIILIWAINMLHIY